MIFYYKRTSSGEKPVLKYIEANNREQAKVKISHENSGCRIVGLGEYLTESKLFYYLTKYFPHSEILYDEPLDNENSHIKPDFRIDFANLLGRDCKLIIEFDGYQHYTKALQVLKDKEKDELYKSKGYAVVRLPYFIQLTQEVVQHYFGNDKDFDNSYKHGFIDEKAVLPADFCELGMERFMTEMKYYHTISPEITKSIFESLTDKIERKMHTNKNWINIIPDSVIDSKYRNELKRIIETK